MTGTVTQVPTAEVTEDANGHPVIALHLWSDEDTAGVHLTPAAALDAISSLAQALKTLGWL
jgi:hypothetical protein